MFERKGRGSNSASERGRGRRESRARRNKDREERDREFALEKKMKSLEDWVPRTELGKKVKAGEINSLDEVFENGYKIMEPQIVDSLVKDLDEKLVDFKKTARVRMAGRQFSFRSTVIVGDHSKYIGVGIAKDRERFPSIRKATQKAKMNLAIVRKGCGSWECGCGTEHSVPFAVEGKCGSVRVKLIPAPRGTGLVIGDNAKDALRFAGISDAWSETKGATDTKLNFVMAAVNALKKTTSMRVQEGQAERGHHNKEEFEEGARQGEGGTEGEAKPGKKRGKKEASAEPEESGIAQPLEFETKKVERERAEGEE